MLGEGGVHSDGSRALGGGLYTRRPADEGSRVVFVRPEGGPGQLPLAKETRSATAGDGDEPSQKEGERASEQEDKSLPPPPAAAGGHRPQLLM